MNEILPVPFELNLDALADRLRIRDSMMEEFSELVSMASEAAQPKVLVRPAYVDEYGDDGVTINGVKFHSVAMRHNLDGIGRVFAYITTCGREVEEMEIDRSDFVKTSWLHYIKLDLLKNCQPVLRKFIRERFGVEKVSSMNPGSGDASVWSIDQQVGLFSLFGDVEQLVGVRLTESFLMVPDVSTSGILFPADRAYQSCQLCHRENCPNRAVPFNAVLWAEVNG